MSQPKAVLFDLGGTLFGHLESTTSEANLHSVANHLMNATQDQTFSVASFTSDYRQQRALVEHEWVTREFFLHRKLVIESFCRALRCQLDQRVVTDDQMLSYANAFCDQQRESVIAELQPRPDLLECLQTLQQQGLVLGIVSNIDEDYLQPLVEKYDLRNYCAFCLSSEAARCCKPASGIFKQAHQLALDRLGRPLAANEILYVGDSPQHDIQGAHNAGMSACLFGDGENYGDALRHLTNPPDAVIEHFDELAQLVKTPQ